MTNPTEWLFAALHNDPLRPGRPTMHDVNALDPNLPRYEIQVDLNGAADLTEAEKEALIWEIHRLRQVEDLRREFGASFQSVPSDKTISLGGRKFAIQEMI